MAAPIGNEYYLLRSKDGRDTQYTPQGLLEGANEYFTWCVENPLKEEQLFHYQGEVKAHDVSKMRVFSLQGLCNFLEIALNTFKSYENRKDFMTVTTRVRGIIENQQLEGAASGFLNPNIIARKLGLSDKTDITSGGKPIENRMQVEFVDYSDDED